MKQITIVFFLTLFVMIEVTAKTTYQTAYRWRHDDGNEITATWKAPENVPIYFEGTDVVRLRIQENYMELNLSEYEKSGEEEEISQYDFIEEISLFYSLAGSEIWVKITNDASSNAFALFNSGNVNDLAPTTRQLAENFSYTYQEGVLFTSTSNHIHTIPSNGYTEYEWSIQPTANANPGVYQFIKGWSGNSELTANTNKAPISFSIAPQPATMYYEVDMPAIPLSNWAIYTSVVLFIGFMVFRFKRLF
jgi:hypothetical protein